MTTKRLFGALVTARSNDEVVVPRLAALMTNPDYRSFSIEMPAAGPRVPDGWFHPSTHPLWTERQLVYYLQACHGVEGVSVGEMEAEERNYTSTLSLAQGTWLHAYLQHLMLVGNLVVVPNPSGKTSADKVEWPLSDPDHNTRGHADGMLDPSVLNLDHPTGLELKSMNSVSLAKIPKGAANDSDRLAWLIKEKPGYYVQAQEYMRMGAYTEQRMVLISPAYPWGMAEIAIPYEPEIAESIAARYLRALGYYRAGTLPDPCCGVRSKEARSCPARYLCPIGRL